MGKIIVADEEMIFALFLMIMFCVFLLFPGQRSLVIYCDNSSLSLEKGIGIVFIKYRYIVIGEIKIEKVRFHPNVSFFNITIRDNRTSISIVYNGTLEYPKGWIEISRMVNIYVTLVFNNVTYEVFHDVKIY